MQQRFLIAFVLIAGVAYLGDALACHSYTTSEGNNGNIANTCNNTQYCLYEREDTNGAVSVSRDCSDIPSIRYGSNNDAFTDINRCYETIDSITGNRYSLKICNSYDFCNFACNAVFKLSPSVISIIISFAFVSLITVFNLH
uniref:Activin_recp domain-containing protein n=1 Tax=Rhabditophanes sp. KR3021 TaxID=114890 RepID=A0AC35U5E4_9BILA